MKIRSGFVSNSSSSSFVVSLSVISASDLQKLLQYSDVEEVPRRGWRDSWSIEVNEEKGIVRGWTSMDNGDLDEYLKANGIDDSVFTYDHNY